MTQEQVIAEISEIFKDVLDDDSIVLTETTTAQDIEDWDSLNHIQLVVAVERKFKVKFTTGEIQSWKNVGDISKAILQKKA